MDQNASEDGGGDDSDESGVFANVETTASKLADCIANCEAPILDLSGALRESCVPELLSEKTDAFLSFWKSLALHRISLGVLLRRMKALLSHRGLSAPYEHIRRRYDHTYTDSGRAYLYMFQRRMRALLSHRRVRALRRQPGGGFCSAVTKVV